MAKNIERKIICVECPNIYDEADIMASMDEISKPLIEVLGKSDTGKRKATGEQKIRKNIFGRTSERKQKSLEADDSSVTRDNLKRLERLKNWTFTCPEGHPVDGNRGLQIPLAVVGVSGSSKSHFLPGLVYETDVLSALRQIGVALRAGPYSSSQLRYAARQLFEEKKILPPTEPDVVSGPYGYRLAIRKGREESRYSLLLFDVGGEALSSFSKIGEQAPFVLLAQGLIILLNPQQVVPTQFDATDAQISEQGRILAAANIRENITLVADALEEYWGMPMTEIPVPACFVIAKADSLTWGYDWEGETERVLKQAGGPKSLRESLLESSARIKEAFADFGGELIIGDIEDRFAPERVRFAAASATGEMPNADGWTNPEPKGISLTLLHVLDMLDKVQVDATKVTPPPIVQRPVFWSPDDEGSNDR